MTIRVLIADDQEMVRAGFAMILGAQDDIEVIASCANGVEAVEAAHQLRPDVALLDIRMPELDGLQATRVLADPTAPHPIQVVIVTTFDLDEYVYAALKAGAVGFVLKDAGPALLIEAVRAAASGQSLISPAVTVRLLARLATDNVSSARQPKQPLTARELEVVRLVARGHTNTEVAQELFVSLGTVKAHLGSVQNKLDARNRVEIAAWAWEAGEMPTK
jgi:DNA-binding NarL/FixJ family response regulator